MRPGAKLLGLLVFAVLVVTIPGPAATVAALAVAVAFALLAGLRGRAIGRVLRGFALVAVLLFAFTMVSTAFAAAPERDAFFAVPAQAWGLGAMRAFVVVGDLLALVLSASALTASTPIADMLDTIAWLLRPLTPLGVKPERVALAFSLMIASVPMLLGIARETREAARARGLDRSPRALLVPFALRTVSHAQLTGEALAARGLGDEA